MNLLKMGAYIQMQMKDKFSGAIIMRKTEHITDLDAIDLSSGWNYNDKITLSDEISC